VDGVIYHFSKDETTGETLVVETKTEDLPSEMEPTETMDFSGYNRNLSPDENGYDPHNRQRFLATEMRYIDVLVPYTKRVYCSVSTGTSTTTCDKSSSRQAAVDALINLAFFEANTALEASGVPGRLRLVKSYMVDPTFDELTLSSVYVTLASKLPKAGDGFLDDVLSKREYYKADLVSMFIDEASSCGLAYTGYPVPKAYGFSVVNVNCATGYYSFAHEIAHNLGAKHDRIASNCSGSSCCGIDCDNFAYQDPTYQFRSILAYNCAVSCPRVQMFSTPDRPFVGADGTPHAIGNDFNDNARHLANNWNLVADFYQGVNDIVPGPTAAPVPAIIAVPATRSPTKSPTRAPVKVTNICGNGLCEPQAGENCSTCPLDCIGGNTFGSLCGNGWCEDGENCASCPQDCASRLDPNTGRVFCCEGGPTTCTSKGAQSCSNTLCWNKRGCSVAKAEMGTFCCGNGKCERGEKISTCPADCKCVNNGVCEPWEDALSCKDCQEIKSSTALNTITCLEALKVCSGIFPDPCCGKCGSKGRCI